VGNPFNVENATTGATVFSVDGSGNVSAAGIMSVTGNVGITGSLTVVGNATQATSPVLNPLISSGPAQAGLLGWSFPLIQAVGTASAACTNSRLYLAGIYLTAGTIVTNIWLYSEASSSGATASENFVGLYDSTGTLQASTTAGSIDTALATAGALKCAVATPYVIPANGLFWVGAAFNASTHNITFFTPTGWVTATTSSTLYQSFANPTLTTANYLFCVNSASVTTSMPTSITLGNNSLTNSFMFWAGVN
jgi:hypothetical protein